MIEYPYHDARLIIFTRAPQAGYCKTRLIPLLGAQGAAGLQQELIENCIDTLCERPLCPTELWCSPDTRQPLFQSLAQAYPLSLHRQQGADLGERMYHAMSSGDSPYTIIVGTDCPGMTRDYVAGSIVRLMAGKDAVIGPAEDGGYVLLALRQVSEGLFQDIAWGTERVLWQTTQKMTASDLIWQAIDTLRDLDDAEDLQRYRALKTGATCEKKY